MSSKYTYTVSTAFTGLAYDEPNIDRFSTEIDNSTIAVALDYIDLYDDTCDIWFVSALSAPDQIILDGYVAIHDGTPGPAPHLVDPDAYTDSSSGHSVGDSWINEKTGIEFVCVNNADDNAVWKIGNLSEHFRKEDEGLFGVVSSEWVDATSLVVNGLASGEYKIQWSFDASGDSNNVEHKYRVVVDNQTTLGDNTIPIDSTSELFPVNGMATVSLSQGSHTLCLQVQSYNMQSEVQVRRRRLVMRRIVYGN